MSKVRMLSPTATSAQNTSSLNRQALLRCGESFSQTKLSEKWLQGATMTTASTMSKVRTVPAKAIKNLTTNFLNQQAQLRCGEFSSRTKRSENSIPRAIRMRPLLSKSLSRMTTMVKTWNVVTEGMLVRPMSSRSLQVPLRCGEYFYPTRPSKRLVQKAITQMIQ